MFQGLNGQSVDGEGIIQTLGIAIQHLLQFPGMQWLGCVSDVQSVWGVFCQESLEESINGFRHPSTMHSTSPCLTQLSDFSQCVFVCLAVIIFFEIDSEQEELTGDVVPETTYQRNAHPVIQMPLDIHQSSMHTVKMCCRGSLQFRF